MKINSYTKSREAFIRATKVIPSGVYGHLGPAEGCFIPVEAFPLFSSRAQGTYFWDVDGHRFIDYMCAFGPNILGYGDPDVEEAAAAGFLAAALAASSAAFCFAAIGAITLDINFMQKIIMIRKTYTIPIPKTIN